MKKHIISVAIVFCAFLILPGLSLAGVSYGKHDLSSTGGGYFMSTNEAEVCIFCHTPHGAISQDSNGYAVPLWNRSLNPSATYSMYNSNTMIATDVPAAPTGVSLLCMSCHDGVSALNVLVNYGVNNPITMSSGYDQLADIYAPASPFFPGANIGELANNAAANAQRNLSNDHPISFTYNTALAGNSNGALHDPGTNSANISPLKLFNYGAKNDVLECATCHEPHDEGPEGLFLRMNNDSSAMCLTCHNK
jgi:predicted CXXCH cytochrome family protein